jgi:hypothetical protein
MKKLLITTIASVSLLALTATSYGQGQIQFQNASDTSPITFGSAAGAFGVPGQRVSGAGGTFTYGLYLGPAGSTLLSQLTLVDTTASPNATSTTTAAAGRIAGGTVIGTGNANATFQITAGTTFAVEILGWSSSSGNNFASAFATGQGLFGSTGIGSITPTASPAGPAATMSGGPLGGFQMNPVPEPTTIALGGLGAAALLFFRRRK